jgi:hypothetical protein
MRILLASDFYPPFIGGAELQVQLLGKELVLRGHEVSAATVWHAGLAEQQDDAGVQVWRLKGLTTSVPWWSKDARRRYHPPFPDPGRGACQRLDRLLVRGSAAGSAHPADHLGARLWLQLRAAHYAAQWACL